MSSTPLIWRNHVLFVKELEHPHKCSTIFIYLLLIKNKKEKINFVYYKIPFV